MTRFIDRASPTVLRPLPNSTAGDLALVLIRVATTEDLEGDKSRSREPAVRQCSSRALQQLLLGRPRWSHPDNLQVLCSSPVRRPLLRPRWSHPDNLPLLCSSHRELRPLPPSPDLGQPGNPSALHAQESKGYRAPRLLAALVRALKRGSSVIEATKALAAHQPGDRRPVAIKPLPVVEVPAALHKAAVMATRTVGVKVLDTNSLWRIE